MICSTLLKIMVILMNRHQPADSELIESVSQAFDGQYFFGIELILDELNDQCHRLDVNTAEQRDWFGIGDFFI